MFQQNLGRPPSRDAPRCLPWLRAGAGGAALQHSGTDPQSASAGARHDTCVPEHARSTPPDPQDDTRSPLEIQFLTRQTTLRLLSHTCTIMGFFRKFWPMLLLAAKRLRDAPCERPALAPLPPPPDALTAPPAAPSEARFSRPRVLTIFGLS